MCVCVRMYIYIKIGTCIYRYILYIHTHLRICLCVGFFYWSFSVNSSMHPRVGLHVHTSKYRDILMCIYICIYIYTDTCIHISTPNRQTVIYECVCVCIQVDVKCQLISSHCYVRIHLCSVLILCVSVLILVHIPVTAMFQLSNGIHNWKLRAANVGSN